MKPLTEKLGHRAGLGSQVWRLPESLDEALATVVADAAPNSRFRIAFARDSAELALAAAEVAAHYEPGGHLWLCYPKKSGRLRTDRTRDKGWEPVHALGLLGVSQVALDGDWSALRFRLRDEIPKLTRRTVPGA